MQIIALPDLHQAIDRLPKIANDLREVDLVLLVGDLTNAGKTEHAIAVLDAVAQFNRNILAVPGNWDTSAVDEVLTDRGINLHRKHLIRDNLAFIGVGGSLPFNETPNEFPDFKFERFLNEAIQELNADCIKILVSHQPPFNTLNDKYDTGSRAVRTFIEQYQPAVCFTGHIHEAQGIDHNR
jgi:uncharacterized protein